LGASPQDQPTKEDSTKLILTARQALVARKFFRLERIYIPLATLAILLLFFLIYQRYYVLQQQTFIINRSFRLLSNLGDQIKSIALVHAAKQHAAGGEFGDGPKSRTTWWHESFQDAEFTLPLNIDRFNPNTKSWNNGYSTVAPSDHLGFRVSFRYYAGSPPTEQNG